MGRWPAGPEGSELIVLPSALPDIAEGNVLTLLGLSFAQPYLPSRHHALAMAIRKASATRMPGSNGSWLMPATV